MGNVILSDKECLKRPVMIWKKMTMKISCQKFFHDTSRMPYVRLGEVFQTGIWPNMLPLHKLFSKQEQLLMARLEEVWRRLLSQLRITQEEQPLLRKRRRKKTIFTVKQIFSDRYF